MPLLEVSCPCCQSMLKVDAETGAVISHQEPEKPRPIEDFETAIGRLKSEPARREEAFRKSFEEQKSHSKVLEKKFDELFKQAKDSPDDKPPVRPFDLD